MSRQDFARYYEDERQFLRDVGREFARAGPDRGQFDFDRVDDPDVHCLLAGVSYLTARIRQKLDDDFPELSHSLLGVLFPNYLRPVPAMGVVKLEFEAGDLRDRLRVPDVAEGERRRHATIRTSASGGKPCTFRTAYPVDVLPIEVQDAKYEVLGGNRAAISVAFSQYGPVDLRAINPLFPLRLYLPGEDSNPLRLLWLLMEYVDEVELGWNGAEPRRFPAAGRLRQVGFEPADADGNSPTALLPDAPHGFDGYRFLQEYAAFPRKFQFVELDLSPAEAAAPARADGQGFELRFLMSRVPDEKPGVGRDSFEVICTPVVNLFQHHARPFEVDHRRPEYLLTPEGEDRSLYEVFAVDSVTVTSPKRREIPPFSTLQAPWPALDGALYYESVIRPAVVLSADSDREEKRRSSDLSTDTYLRFVTRRRRSLPTLRNGQPDLDALAPLEKLSVDLLCTNRRRPNDLGLDARAEALDGFGALAARARFLGSISRPVPPPLGGDLSWRLVSHLALNPLSLATADSLRGVLELYDFHALQDERLRDISAARLRSIEEVRTELGHVLLRGLPVRVAETRLTVNWTTEKPTGELYLFACVLDRFLSQSVAVNCLSRLTLRNQSTGREWRFPARGGAEVVL